jgi:hypothetical protein
MSDVPLKYPDLTIRFAHEREAELIGEMTRLAKAPWSRQVDNTHGQPAEHDYFYFHRDEVDTDPPLATVLKRREPGVLIVTHVLPDEIGPELDVPQYDRILREFDAQIVDPAAKAVEGWSDIDSTEYRLEDYFSPRAVELLTSFSQCNNYGSHPSDREIWYKFLLQVFDDGNNVDADLFRNCLKASGIWPQYDVNRLAREYYMAMEILERSGRPKSSSQSDRT